MDVDGHILDYASPRKRPRLQLPARSVLQLRIDRDEVVLTETLQGEAGSAIGGLLFAMGLMASQSFISFSPDNWHRMVWQQLAILGAFAAAEVSLMLAVIHQTWRKTLLTVRYAEVLLSFTSPLQRRHQRWERTDIVDMIVVETANLESASALGELLITLSGGGESASVHRSPSERALESAGDIDRNVVGNTNHGRGRRPGR